MEVFCNAKPIPKSCDTFVAVEIPSDILTPRNQHASKKQKITVFGKNSDRPNDEQHEVLYLPQRNYEEKTTVKCQYITIPQIESTNSVIISRPSWLWGCEMGANEWGLCAGNEAVWTREEAKCDDGVQRLIGMDLVRLVLERAKTSREAVTVCSSLLEEYGQGGGCAEDDSSWCYENGFLFADKAEAWVLETAGKNWWAAERVKPGSYRNISNGLSIRHPDLMHDGLIEYCKSQGWLDTIDSANGFDWKSVLTGSSGKEKELEPSGREKIGLELLKRNFGTYPTKEEIYPKDMLPDTLTDIAFSGMANILRNDEICMQGGFQTTGSQISVMTSQVQNSEMMNDVHFFTNYNPYSSIYKPFIFPSHEQFVKTQDSSKLANLGMKTKSLWSQYHRMTRRDRKSIRKNLLAKEKDFLHLINRSSLNLGSSKNIFETCLDEESAIIHE